MNKEYLSDNKEIRNRIVATFLVINFPSYLNRRQLIKANMIVIGTNTQPCNTIILRKCVKNIPYKRLHVMELKNPRLRICNCCS